MSLGSSLQISAAHPGLRDKEDNYLNIIPNLFRNTRRLDVILHEDWTCTNLIVVEHQWLCHTVV